MKNTTKNQPVETLKQGLESFYLVGMPARDWSTRTRRAYYDDIHDLLEFLEKSGITALSQVALYHLESYQAELDRQGLKASSRERKTYSIKSFFEFLLRQKLIQSNIANQLIPPKGKDEDPRFLTEDEYKRLLREVSHQPRDAAIVEVFLQTGIRLSELAGLTLSDVYLPKKINQDPENVGWIKVKRKGGKTQHISLNYKACQALASYLKVRPDVESDAVFISKFKLPISRRTIQHMITTTLEKIGITDASVHSLRHTTATHHAKKGTNLRDIQELLGHARLETTARYVSLIKEAQRQAVQKNAL